MSIQERRRGHGWTQEQLAEHAGVSVRTIQRIERGDTATLETLKCLAARFESSVSSLIEEQKMTTTSDTNAIVFDTHLEQEAIEYVRNLKGFHLHWITFVVVIPCLLVFNLWITPNDIWIGWVAVSWGLAFALHAFMIFGMSGLFGAKWEQRAFEKRMNQTRPGYGRPS